MGEKVTGRAVGRECKGRERSREAQWSGLEVQCCGEGEGLWPLTFGLSVLLSQLPPTQRKERQPREESVTEDSDPRLLALRRKPPIQNTHLDFVWTSVKY